MGQELLWREFFIWCEPPTPGHSPPGERRPGAIPALDPRRLRPSLDRCPAAGITGHRLPFQPGPPMGGLPLRERTAAALDLGRPLF